MKQSTSPQVKYSLDNLSEALFNIMKNDSYQEITITQICQYAQITRTTFYRNCNDKSDLIDYAITQKVIHLLENVPWTTSSPIDMYSNFFAYWYSHKNFLTVLKRQGLFPRFYSIFTDICFKNLELEKHNPLLKTASLEDHMRLFRASFLIGGLCNMIEQWCENDFETPIATLVEILNERNPNITKESM